MATDYGGPGSGPAWSSPPGEPSPDGPAPGLTGRPRRGRRLAALALAAGLAGGAVSVAGVVNQAGTREFSAAQREQITSWEYGQRWRSLTANQIFPPTVSYAPPSTIDDDRGLKLGADRAAIARASSECAAVTDPAAAAVLDRAGCTALLRATYVDQTSSYVVTVGAAVLPGQAQAAAAARALAREAGSSGLGPTVRPVAAAGTPAASFTGKRRQLSGVAAAGTYVVLYTVGYADSRPAEPVSRDSYTDNEMTSAGLGVTHSVLSALAAPVPAPHCPGSPGC